ncbi:DUF3219 family protein [Lentibacillus salinarum]|uniref:DUF3219 family protein n=1 Tax=Lentibacillus salinarum TaxID=446820 RepID=A0ABW3ZZ56_9BACI
MSQKVIINDMTFHAFHFQTGSITENGRNWTKVSFAFNVTHEDYHDVTTLLYKNDFMVNIPAENLEFPAVIHNYSTSITNLYEPGNTGEFRLELVEKPHS